MKPQIIKEIINKMLYYEYEWKSKDNIIFYGTEIIILEGDQKQKEIIAEYKAPKLSIILKQFTLQHFKFK